MTYKDTSTILGYVWDTVRHGNKWRVGDNIVNGSFRALKQFLDHVSPWSPDTQTWNDHLIPRGLNIVSRDGLMDIWSLIRFADKIRQFDWFRECTLPYPYFYWILEGYRIFFVGYGPNSVYSGHFPVSPGLQPIRERHLFARKIRSFWQGRCSFWSFFFFFFKWVRQSPLTLKMNWNK